MLVSPSQLLTGSSNVSLSVQAEKLRGRMTVVLDLDGTLISSFTPSRAPRLPSGMVSYVVGRGQKLNPGGVFVIERPGLQAFLERLNEFAGTLGQLE